MRGLKVGAFELTDELGRGGMAQVWRAAYRWPAATDAASLSGSTHDVTTESEPQLVALKVLTAARARSEGYAAALRREVRAIASLDHPHILVVLDHGQVSRRCADDSKGHLAAGSPWLAMELASGGSLRPHRGVMSWLRLRQVLLELLDALAHAHARGVLHRDVKPDNVLFGDWGDGVKLADFGISHPLYGQRTHEPVTSVVGTPAYMAPEQLDGRVHDFGPWTDLYGLGCLAFELACGAKPYQATSNFSAMAQAHLTWPLPPVPTTAPVADGFEAWVHRLLHKNCRGRYQMAADAAHGLRQLADPLVVTTTAQLTSTRLEPTASKELPQPEDDTTVTTLGEAPAVSTTTVCDDGPAPKTPTGAAPLAPVSTDPSTWSPAQLQRARPAPLVGAGLGLYGLRTVPFVARDEERRELWRLLQDVAASGRAEVVLLAGSAGTGKSRLAQWLSERAHESGVGYRAHAVHDPDGGATSGLVPMLERLYRCEGLDRHLVAHCVANQMPSAAAGDVAALVSLLRPLKRSTDMEPSIWLDAPDARYAAMARALSHAAHDRPVVLWLDDVHWGADALSFVSYMLRSQHQRPVAVLVVMTARQEELANRPIERELLEQILAAPTAHRCEIGPLPKAIQGPFVEQVLGLRGDLAARVRVRTAGNPSFAVQLVGDWVARGLLQPSRSGFHLCDEAEVELPDDVYAIWSVRIARLFERRPLELQALQMAAILGRYVEWTLACRKHGIQPDGPLEPLLRSLLRELAEQGLAEVHGPSAWSFVHGMLHESLERSVRELATTTPTSPWAQMHDAAAQVLLQLAANEPGQAPPERLGRHLLEAGRADSAIAPLMESVRRHLAGRDLALAQVSAGRLRRALARTGQDESQRVAAQASLLEAKIARRQGRIDAAANHLTAANPVARDGGHTDLLAQLQCEAAIVAYRAGDLESAVTRSHEGQHLAEQLQQPALVASCLEVRGRAFTDRGLLEQAETCFSDAHAIYRSAGANRGVASCELGLGWVAMTRGQLLAAHRWVERARISCEQRELHVLLGVCMNMLGEVERKRGNLAEAQRCYRDAVRRHQSCGALASSVIAELNLALVHIQCDELSQASALATAAQRSIQLTGARQFLAAVHLILVTCAAAAGRWDAWPKHFDQANELLQQSGQVHADLATLAERTAQYAQRAGRTDFADQATALAEQQWHHLATRHPTDEPPVKG